MAAMIYQINIQLEGNRYDTREVVGNGGALMSLAQGIRIINF